MKSRGKRIKIWLLIKKISFFLGEFYYIEIDSIKQKIEVMNFNYYDAKIKLINNMMLKYLRSNSDHFNKLRRK
jgi:hypothetical protein